jgi:hypothetical protein
MCLFLLVEVHLNAKPRLEIAFAEAAEGPSFLRAANYATSFNVSERAPSELP